jgi:hypothetical protein
MPDRSHVWESGREEEQWAGGNGMFGSPSLWRAIRPPGVNSELCALFGGLSRLNTVRRGSLANGTVQIRAVVCAARLRHPRLNLVAGEGEWW